MAHRNPPDSGTASLVEFYPQLPAKTPLDVLAAILEEQCITQTINNLLDNITPANREFVDRRLKELTKQRHQLETRLDELDRLTATQSEIQAILSDTLRFLSGLEFTLRNGLPQERLTALRQCIERIHVNKPAAEVKIRVRTVPGGTLQGDETMVPSLDTACPKESVS